MSVARDQRHLRAHPCPVCGGKDEDPRGKGRRCNGFTSPDGAWCHCSRTELAGPIDPNDAGLFVHRMHGPCTCGETHGDDLRPKREPEAIYPYTDEGGELLFEVVRFPGKQFRQRKPDGAGGHEWKLNGVRRVPYRLGELVNGNADRPVYIPEGERDVETLVKRGHIATTNPGGAGKWSAVALVAKTALQNRDVIVIADDDPPDAKTGRRVGHDHARDVEASLCGIARSIRVVTCTRGKDITDHFAAGGTLDELVPIARAAKPPICDEETEPTNGNVRVNAGVGEDRSETPHHSSFARGDHVELAQALVAVLGTTKDVVGDEGAVWRYNAATGLYAEIDSATQSRAVQGFAGTPVGETRAPKKLKATDVYGVLKLAYDRVAVRDFFANAPAGMVFTNGFATVTAKGIELRPHARENRARYGYAFELSPSSLAAKHLKFLYDLWQPDEDREDKILLWQEFGGACLLGIAPTYQRCLVGIGEGCNGKSKAGDILLAVMPEGSTCSIAPQEFGQEYRRAMLAGKRLNVVNELPEADIIESESFKNIITGETITGRHIRQAPITFRPKAGHYFAANRLPGTNDQTLGFWRRFLVATFNRNFTNDPVRNARIAEEIIEAERPAIVRWFLEGGVRLLRERDYTIPESHHAAMAAWRRIADPVALFVEEQTEPCQAIEGSQAAWLYTNFRNWAERNGHRVMSSTKFGMRMAALERGAEHFDTGNRYPVRLKAPEDNPSGNPRARAHGYN